MHKSVHTIACLSLMLFVAAQAIASDEFDLDLFRPRAEVAVEASPDADITGTDNGTVSMNTASFGGFVPIGGTHFKKQGRLFAYQILAHGQVSDTPMTLSMPDVEIDRMLYAGKLGVTGVFISQARNRYILSLGSSFAEDEDSISNLQPRFSGLGIGSYRISKPVSLLYGGVFGYSYGKGLALPLVGAEWKISDKWSFTGIVPFSLKATYKPTEVLKIRMLAGIAGNNYRFQNSDELLSVTKDNDLRLKTVGARISAQAEYEISNNLTIQGELGFQGKKKISFLDESDDEVLSVDTDPTPFAGLALRYNFGPSLWNNLE